VVNGSHSIEIPMKILKNNWDLQKIHIISWLFKDIFWTLKWVWMATIMIIPTAFLTIYILITEKENRDTNMILMSWVFMNIFWMLHELHETSYLPVQFFMVIGLLCTFKLLKR
jgi:hypothetical protein